MSEAINFFNGILNETLSDINCCTLGKIEKFDPTAMKADVAPLAKVRFTDGSIRENPLLIEVPVSFLKAGPFFIRPPYKKGDIVLIVFADRDLDNVLLTGNSQFSNSKRKHALDDAIVVGAVMPFTTNLPSEHVNDLIIAKDDLSAKIVIAEDGAIEINSTKEIKISSNKKVTILGPTQSSTWD